jgi:hypothetical protein
LPIDGLAPPTSLVGVRALVDAAEGEALGAGRAVDVALGDAGGSVERLCKGVTGPEVVLGA